MFQNVFALALVCFTLTRTLGDDKGSMRPSGASVRPSEQMEIKRFVYMNMESSKDRRKHMEEMLVPHGIPVERVVPLNVNGTWGLTHDWEIGQHRKFCKFTENNHDVSMKEKPGASSLYLTTKMIVEKVCDNKVEGAKPGDLVMILEDDVNFDPEWDVRFEAAMHSLYFHAPNWTVSRFGSWGNQRKEDKINKYWHRVKEPIFEGGWPPRYYYHGILSLVLEVGKRSAPLCKLLREGEICWIEHKLMDPSFETYVIDHRYTVAHHGDFESVRAKIDGSRRGREKRKHRNRH